MQTKSENRYSGIVLAYKPPGTGSAALTGMLRKSLGIRSAGHAGTLDRFAEGLMVLVAGKATPFADFFLHQNKAYKAVFRFGTFTDTHDPSGAVTEERSAEESREFIKNNIKNIKLFIESFVHETEQVPPVYSALKKDGRRFSDYARSGAETVPEKRKIRILKSEFKEADSEECTVSAYFEVSSGTYIRSIARDLSVRLGFPLHLSRLIRTQSGRFSLEKNKDHIWYPPSPDRDNKTTSENQPVLIRIQDALPDWPCLTLKDPQMIKAVSHGRPFALSAAFTEKLSSVSSDTINFLIENTEGDLLAWGIFDRHSFRYKRVFA